MFNHISSTSNDTKLNEFINSKQSPQKLDDISRETLNPKFYKDDSDEDTLIIPDFYKEEYKDQIYSNVCNFAEIPNQRRSSESEIHLEMEEKKYTDDVIGAAKNLIFSDLSLGSWSNKDVSISSHSEFVKYDTNKRSDKSNIILEKEFGADKSPILSPAHSNFIKHQDEQENLSEHSSQDSVLYSPMNLTKYKLPVDEAEELMNSKVLYESKIIQNKRVLYKPQKRQSERSELENQTPEILKNGLGKHILSNLFRQ